VAWTKWASLATGDAPTAYVRRIIFTSYLRSRERRWVGEVAHADLPDSGGEADPYAHSDDRHAMLGALRYLPPRQRTVIALRYLDDLSERDAAAALGCSIGAIKSHSAKAIAHLRKTSLLNDLLGEGARE
jgi:RNA polymerase sigma factor (sigma-70 family)